MTDTAAIDILCHMCGKPILKRAPVRRLRRQFVHVECKQRRSMLLSTPHAAIALQISSKHFLDLTRQLNIEPAGWYANPHARSGPDCPLWAPEEVTALAQHPALHELKSRIQAARDARHRKAQERAMMFAERYPQWEDACGPAAEALFNLNRYAKWHSCASAHRDEIYALKNRFVRLLYECGYCTEVQQHTVGGELRESACWGCYGDGCERCEGTGVYTAMTRLQTYIAFRFQIQGKSYAWHQPTFLVTWPIVEAESIDRGQWEPEQEKPLNLSPRKFAEAKALVRYVLERAKATHK